MLECLEFRNEKNSLGTDSLQYGKFSFSRLQKGQGLTIANTLRRVLLYELPAVGITSVLIRTSNEQGSIEQEKSFSIQSTQSILKDSGEKASSDRGSTFQGYVKEPQRNNDPSNQNTQTQNITKISAPPVAEPPGKHRLNQQQSGIRTGKEEIPPQLNEQTILSPSSPVQQSEISLLSEIASSHHEFSTLPGIKESVLEILFNLKCVVFENIFPYSSIQKGSLKLSVLEASASKMDVMQSQNAQVRDFEIKASQFILPSEIRIIHPDQVLATLISPHTNFELEFTIEKITQSDLTSTSSFSGRAPNRSTRNRRILPIDGTVFPVKKVNYTIEQDSFGKEIVFFEIWTNGALAPREAMFQSIENVIKLFQTFQD